MKTTNSINCGSCSGLERDRLIDGCRVCSTQGIIPTSKPCHKYKANAFELAKKDGEEDILATLGNSISKFTVGELQVLAGLFLAEKQTRKLGFRFWQKVYYRYSGTGSHLDCYIACRVLDAKRSCIRLISDTGKVCIEIVPGFGDSDIRSSIFSVEEFKHIKNRLVAEGNIKTPKIIRKRVVALDLADASIVDPLLSYDPTKASKRSDLVSLVKQMSSGKILSREEASLGHNYQPKTKYKAGDEIKINFR